MPKKLITKHISDLTDEDKVQYIAYLKESFDVNYGLDWDSLVPQIMEKIEFIFSHDDETDPDPASIAARAYFMKYGKQGQRRQGQENSPAPSLADFMIFGAAFQKGIDEVSWWADVNDSTGSTSSTDSASSTTSTDGSTAHVITSQAPMATSSAMDSSAKTSKTSVAKNRDKEGSSSEGRGKENKCSKGQSLLSPADKDLFYNTYFSLIDYVNRKYGIIRGLNVLEEQDSINPEELNAIASKLWANPKKEIDAYLAANHQEPETEELLQSWKRRIKGRFVIERYLKQGTIFISLTPLTSITSITEKNKNEENEENEENENEDVGNANNAGNTNNTNNTNANNAGNVYFVKGLSSGYEAMFRNEKLPLMVDATLLPFKNVIITDGLVAPYGLRFIGKLKNAYKEVYLKAKHEGRIYTEL